eukprot:11195168-Lingulodinium_polyedra.AAC.1
MKECASSTDYSQIAEAMKTSCKEFRTLKGKQGPSGRTGKQRPTRGRIAYGVEEDIEIHKEAFPTAPAY